MNTDQWLALDTRLSARMRIAESPGLLRTLAAVLAHSADSWFWLLGLAILWRFGDPFWQERARIFIIGILITAGIVMIIKFTIRRQRPEGEWGGVYRKTDPHSFPSGHAARAVLLMVMSLGLGPLWFALLLVLWAPLVALARVVMGVHYLLDILAGVVLGGVVGVAMLFLPRLF